MNTNDRNYQVLLKRNAASMAMDDLVARVVDSTLAESLRNLSNSIMEMNPGFGFDISRANHLYNTIKRALDDYSKKRIKDVDLVNFQTTVSGIMSGEKHKEEANFFSRINDLFVRQDKRKQLEEEYIKVCQEIAACNQEMKRCVSACRGLPRDSYEYRANERAYDSSKRKKVLMEATEVELRTALDAADRMRLLEEFNARNAHLNSMITEAIGTEKDMERVKSRVEMTNERVNNQLEMVSGLSDVFTDMETQQSGISVDSEFSALVAESERRRSVADMSMSAEPDQQAEQQVPPAEMDDFTAPYGAVTEENT